MKRKLRLASILPLVAAAVLGAAPAAYPGSRVLRMATTTSTDNTGLLDYLAPHFKADTGIELRWVAVGTGRAIALGRNCDVDVLMVHDPEAEREFARSGYGVERRQFMYNDFVIIGPNDDSAGIREKPVEEALRSIADRSAFFTSRGDGSGTHMKEVSLWKAAGLPVPDREPWYIQTGQGMINTIQIAEELDAYTITDRGTYISYEVNRKGNPSLVILVEGDRYLRNQYSVIAVNPRHCGDARIDLAGEFIKWIVLPDTQRLIAGYTLMGKQLFIPTAYQGE